MQNTITRMQQASVSMQAGGLDEPIGAGQGFVRRTRYAQVAHGAPQFFPNASSDSAPGRGFHSRL